MCSLLGVLCIHIVITSFLIRLTPPLLLIAKYTRIILAMLITPDLICRTNIKQFTILHLGLKQWNSLPHNLTELTSYSSFKTSLKKYLIERAIN